jgi:hypothetical protein
MPNAIEMKIVRRTVSMIATGTMIMTGTTITTMTEITTETMAAKGLRDQPRRHSYSSLLGLETQARDRFLRPKP